MYLSLSKKNNIFIAILAFIAFSFSSAKAETSVKPTGKLVNLGYAKMHLICLGKGGPTVILDAGAGGWSIHWFEVQKELSKFTRVCSYDRLGLGWSDLGEMPRTVRKDAQDLHQLLQKSGEKAPFILAGHSYGGYIARVYYDMFPENIAGIALIDSAHEKQWEALPGLQQMLQFGISAAKGNLEKAKQGKLKKKDFPMGVTPQLLPIYQAQMLETKTHQTGVSVLENTLENAKEVEKTKKLGNLPLLVLSAGNSFASFIENTETNRPMLETLNKGWLEMQSDLAKLSANSQHIVSQKDLHWFTVQNPKLIAANLMLLIEKTR
jgi:pimeloyl-ACP methyl ester carboxylesterase